MGRFDYYINSFRRTYGAEVPDGMPLPSSSTDVPEPTELPSPHNTCVLSVGSCAQPFHHKIEVFARSARKQHIPLTFISYREPWRGFVYHKMLQFQRHLPQLINKGFRYCFLLDSFDVVFTDPLEVLCDKARTIYEPGTVLYNAELDYHIFPHKDPAFHALVKEEGCHLNAGALFGSFQAVNEVFGQCLELQYEMLSCTPRSGILTSLMSDTAVRCNLGTWSTDDQFLAQINSLYFPHLYRADTARALLAWTTELIEPLAELRLKSGVEGMPGNASVLHSSASVHNLSENHWFQWCRQNELI